MSQTIRRSACRFIRHCTDCVFRRMAPIVSAKNAKRSWASAISDGNSLGSGARRIPGGSDNPCLCLSALAARGGSERSGRDQRGASKDLILISA